MDKATFRNYLRMLANDSDTSNLILREKLSDRPGNKFDGVNKVLFLFNRRIVAIDQIYDEANNIIDPASYTLTPATGKIVTTDAWTNENAYADYYWERLNNTEVDLAIDTAAAPGGFDANNIPESGLDYIGLYTLAFYYLSIASKAGEFYTLSAGGKQVSKSEIFNHYFSLYQNALDKAQALRTDKFTDRGNRETPFDASSSPSWVAPYVSDSNE